MKKGKWRGAHCSNDSKIILQNGDLMVLRSNEGLSPALTRFKIFIFSIRNFHRHATNPTEEEIAHQGLLSAKNVN